MLRAVFLLVLFPAIFVARAEAALENLSLQQVYALSQAEVESEWFGLMKDTCDGLVSSAGGSPGKDPHGLSPAQVCAIQHYSNAGYLVNPKLWATEADGKALSGLDWAYVRVLDSALAKLPAEPVTTVYRGTSRAVKFSRPGEIVRLKGYSSTTVSKDVAEGFVTERMMIIKAKNGKNIQRYSNAGMEKELLLPRSTRVRFEKSETKVIEIFTEENGPEKREVEFVYLTEM